MSIRLAAAAMAVWAISGSAWAESGPHGVQLPNDAQKVGENRYRVATNLEDTLKYYKSVYPAQQYPRKPIVNQPGIKAVHLAFPPGRPVEGLNIYQTAEETRIYVVPTETKPKRRTGKHG